MDCELFSPVGNTGAALEQAERAKAVCAGCPVCGQCLDYALDTNQDGIWGGMTEDERRSLRRAGQRRRGR
jgi:WhiB family transcriptional regulator, redox-sensing transcriptional regulator